MSSGNQSPQRPAAAESSSRPSADNPDPKRGLRNELDESEAVTPRELNGDPGGAAAAVDGWEEEPLERLLGAPMAVVHFLRLAIGIATALGRLHASGLIHKDMKPANILLNRTTRAVRLTGFGIASRLTRERYAPMPPEFIAGTLVGRFIQNEGNACPDLRLLAALSVAVPSLRFRRSNRLAYIAPEQTGRINRSVDSRCDLYSLGRHPVPDAHRRLALHRFGCHGMGPPPCPAPTHSTSQQMKIVRIA
jgi:serine/threonine protein kinase